MDISEKTYLANNAKEGEKMISRDLLQQRNLRVEPVFLEKKIGLEFFACFFFTTELPFIQAPLPNRS